MPLCILHPLSYQANPADYFARVRHAPGAMLLESGRPVAARGRFDLLSAWPIQTLTPADGENGRAFFQRLRASLAELGQAELPDDQPLPFAGGLLGYLAYDFGQRLEPLPSTAQDDLNVADAHLGLYAWAMISDHQQQTSQLLFHPSLASEERQRLIALFEAPPPSSVGCYQLTGKFVADLSASDYRRGIERIQTYIQAGDCYQVNFTQRFKANSTGDPWAAYCRLREACPTPFSGYIALGGDDAVLSFSPERFVKVSQGQVQTRPIKGTRPRRADPTADAAEAAELLASPKDRAENLMIVDLLRNDLGRSCKVGSVRVPELFSLESYPNVHHLVSCITGELADGQDVLDLLAGSFPGGSITGAPKIRAMQVIDELEPTRRGLYCGSLLYLDVRGEMDSSITIRTLLVKGGQTFCWGGGGIVADSDCDAEYQESIGKVRLLLDTLESL